MRTVVVEIPYAGVEIRISNLVRSLQQRALHGVDEFRGLLTPVPDTEKTFEFLPAAGLLDFTGGIGEVIGLVRVKRADCIKIDKHALIRF